MHIHFGMLMYLIIVVCVCVYVYTVHVRKHSYIHIICFTSKILASIVGGEVYAWGTNSMGQCGQGHNNGSITTPTKVQGLEGVQVQQISAGTSHSVVWTAMPMNRCDINTV